MIHEIKLWWFRNFKILSEKQALELKLNWISNVYGDKINYLNCRSIYVDNKNKYYRILELNYSEYN
jgi:hypothetical protein